MSKKGRSVSSSRTLLVCLLTSFILIPSYLQSSSGIIEGVVQDEAGGILPGVNVTLSGPALMASKTAVTNEKGFFRFGSLSKGTYSVKAEHDEKTADHKKKKHGKRLTGLDEQFPENASPRSAVQKERQAHHEQYDTGDDLDS
jgi:hypothetical protein